jgi:hypothetical protein
MRGILRNEPQSSCNRTNRFTCKWGGPVQRAARRGIPALIVFGLSLHLGCTPPSTSQDNPVEQVLGTSVDAAGDLQLAAISDATSLCKTTSKTWQNAAFGSQTGTFTAEFDAIPNAANMDGVVALSAAAATGYANCSAIVRFNSDGMIDARNGSSYKAAVSMPYTAGTSYHFRMPVNVAAKTYSVYVAPQNGPEQTLATDYGFRASATSLANWGTVLEAGSMQVCNFMIAGCQGAGSTWTTWPMTSQTGAFTAEFDASPSTTTMDGVVGLAPTTATSYAGYAAMVRFNSADAIDVRNGANYSADAAMSYTAGASYHVRMEVDVPSRTYSVYVTAPGKAEQLLASNYTFRSEQITASALTSSGAVAEVGSCRVCGFKVNPHQPKNQDILAVTPTTGLTSKGYQGGSTFTPPSGTYTLANPGTANLNWTAATAQNWLGLSKTSGSLAPGAIDSVTASITTTTASAMAPATYNGSVVITNTTSGTGNSTIPMTLVLNGPPVADAATATVTQNTPKQITLTGSDADGQPLAFAVSANPAHGTVSQVTAASSNTATVTYAPASGYSGGDTFKFRVNNGVVASPEATVTITVGSACATATTAWQTVPYTAENGVFTYAFDMVPGAANMDAVVGLSSGAASAYSGFAAMVRLNESGNIDARNGADYAADAAIAYTPGVSYHVRMVVNVPAHTYSVYVGQTGGTEQTLGTDYAFRSEQAAVTSLNSCGYIAEIGSMQLCAYGIVPSGAIAAEAGPAKSTAPGGAVTLEGSASGASGSFTYAWTPTTGLSAANVARPTCTPTATTTYTLKAACTVSGATATDTVTVSVTANPLVANAGPDKSITSGGTTLQGSASGGTPPYTYSWSPTSTLSSATVAQPTASPTTTTTYTLTVKDAAGATATDYVNVAVVPVGNGAIPIARWDLPPYQRVNAGETLKAGVVAFSKFGINTVSFTISGGGYTGGTVNVGSMTYNDQSNVYEYWLPISASSFTSDGQITVNATVYGNDGGVRAMPAMTFFVNPKGTRSQAQVWVDASAGNDSTGVVNDNTKPCKTIGSAIGKIQSWMSSNGRGSVVDGGIIRLRPGTHMTSNPGSYSCSEWLTIMADTGGTTGNTILKSGGSAGYSVTHLHVKGVTLDRSGGGSVILDYASELWVDGCNELGSGQYNAASYCIGLSSSRVYSTECSISNCDYPTLNSNTTYLARGLKISNISNDAFQNVPMVVNCSVNNIDPGSTGAHADCIGDWTATSPEGCRIVYGLRATNLHYQGIWDNQDSHYSTPLQGYAFVNVYLGLASPIVSGGGGSAYAFSTDHLLFWHVSLVAASGLNPHTLGLYSDGGATRQQTNMKNVSIRGCRLEGFTISNNMLSVDQSDITQNHFVTGSAMGSQATTGSAPLNSDGTPPSGSTLLNRVSPLLVPADLSNILRGVPADIGALQGP